MDEKFEEVSEMTYDAITNSNVGSDEYKEGIKSLETIEKIRLDREKFESEQFNNERQMALAEVKAKSEARVREKELDNDRFKTKVNAGLKILGFGGLIASTIWLIREDEFRNAKDGRSFIKTLFSSLIK